jgi:hypothetical protein
LRLTTLQRWRRQFGGDRDGVDRRKGSCRHVSHRLSEEERQRILLTCIELKFQRFRQARSCPPCPNAGFISVQSAASSECSMLTARASGEVEPAHYGSLGQFHDTWPQHRIRFGAGTSSACPPPCVACACTSAW